MKLKLFEEFENQTQYWLDYDLVRVGMYAYYGGRIIDYNKTEGIECKVIGIYTTKFLKENPSIYHKIVDLINSPTGYQYDDLEKFADGVKIFVKRCDTKTFIFGWYPTGSDLYRKIIASNSIGVPLSEGWKINKKLNTTNDKTGVFEKSQISLDI